MSAASNEMRIEDLDGSYLMAFILLPQKEESYPFLESKQKKLSTRNNFILPVEISERRLNWKAKVIKFEILEGLLINQQVHRYVSIVS